jgi:hypothetical protein
LEKHLKSQTHSLAESDRWTLQQVLAWHSAPVVVQIQVLQARNLKAMDRTGLADPYVVLRCGDQVHKTKPQKQTLAPQWSQEPFEFVVGARAISTHAVDPDLFFTDFATLTRFRCLLRCCSAHAPVSGLCRRYADAANFVTAMMKTYRRGYVFAYVDLNDWFHARRWPI